MSSNRFSLKGKLHNDTSSSVLPNATIIKSSCALYNGLRIRICLMGAKNEYAI